MTVLVFSCFSLLDLKQKEVKVVITILEVELNKNSVENTGYRVEISGNIKDKLI